MPVSATFTSSTKSTVDVVLGLKEAGACVAHSLRTAGRIRMLLSQSCLSLGSLIYLARPDNKSCRLNTAVTVGVQLFAVANITCFALLRAGEQQLSRLGATVGNQETKTRVLGLVLAADKRHEGLLRKDELRPLIEQIVQELHNTCQHALQQAHPGLAQLDIPTGVFFQADVVVNNLYDVQDSDTTLTLALEDVARAALGICDQTQAYLESCEKEHLLSQDFGYGSVLWGLTACGVLLLHAWTKRR
eukprot:g36228.t1